MWTTWCARWRLRGLIQDWLAYRDVVRRLLEGAGESGLESERFLRLQARIASRLPLLTTALPGALAPEGQQHAAAITARLSLPAPEPAGESRAWGREAFEHEWQEHFIFLNKLKGVALGPISPTARPHAARVSDGTTRGRLRRPIPGARLVGFIVRVAILAVAVYLLGRAFGLRWDAAGRFAPETPRGASGVIGNLWSGVQSVWSAAVGLLDPVVAAYGSTLTIALVAILVIAVAFWRSMRG